MSELAIMLASHGGYAQGAMECIEMIMGKPDNCEVISVLPDKTPELVLTEINQAYERLDKSKGVLILVDIVGGTPCNLTGRLVMEKEQVLLYSGFNIPVLVEVMMNRHLNLEEMKEKIEAAYEISLINVNDMLKRDKEEKSYADQLC